MWTNPTADIKCPRGDCAHYKTAADEQPCMNCTCNRYGSGVCRAFRYTPKNLPGKEKKHDPGTDH